MMTTETNNTETAVEQTDDEIEIPFIAENDVATGQEERIKLFARIVAKKQAVPRDWLVAQLEIAEGSLGSLIARYGYSSKTVKTTSGTKAIRISIKPIKKADKKSKKKQK